jgi:sarcosine oxidase subunit beta
MTDTADIVIIGGGIVGTSIAFHLARRGFGTSVILVERNSLGSGTTAFAVGGIRSQFSTEVNIRFSLESVRFWRRFEDELGGLSAGYHEYGYVFLAQTLAEREQFEQNVALQNSLGVPARLISPAEVQTIVPGLFVDDLTAGAYNSEDAVAGPNDATLAYATRARDAGVQIREGVEVTAIDTGADGARVRGVETSHGRVETPIVVNAAGPWASQVAALVGVDVPVKPYRREIFVSEPFPRELIGDVPIVIDLHVGWYFRREGAGILMSGNKDTHSSWNQHVSWPDFPRVAEFATHRMPVLEQAEFGKKAWAGLYDVSPDDHAILGVVPGLQGFYLACGFSGHGFQHSPATGRLMAELLLDGQASGIDIAPLSIDRFRTGALLHEPLTAHAGTIGG